MQGLRHTVPSSLWTENVEREKERILFVKPLRIYIAPLHILLRHIFLAHLWWKSSFTATTSEVDEVARLFFLYLPDPTPSLGHVAGGHVMVLCAECRRADERGSSGHHRALGRFGDYACHSSLALVESAARHMRARHAENVEFVLWTG